MEKSGERTGNYSPYGVTEYSGGDNQDVTYHPDKISRYQ
jgi:hypothetical protein